MEICDIFKYNGVSNDVIHLRLFPFTLKDRAKVWLNSQPPALIITWDNLARGFLAKYFPPATIAKIVKDITTFQQFENESLCDAWERFKELQRSFSYHGLPKDVLIHTFYNGVIKSTRDTINAVTGGSLIRKTIEGAFELLEKMANNNCLWPSEDI